MESSGHTGIWHENMSLGLSLDVPVAPLSRVAHQFYARYLTSQVGVPLL
jgi:hypothetical protein